MGPEGNTGKRILIVDQDAATVEILQTNLAHAGFLVNYVRNGKEALSIATETPPDLIIMEYILADLDGLEVCQRLKQSPATRSIPVMILSARSMTEERIAGLSAGAEDFVAKPFDPIELVARVRSLMRRTRPEIDISRLTGLPGPNHLQTELRDRLTFGQPVALLHLDLDNLRLFNTVFGFAQGDRAIQLLASIIQQAAIIIGNPNDLVVHLGEDDFAVVTTPDRAGILCQDIVESFDLQIRSFYDRQTLQNGYIEWPDRQGYLKRHQLMTVSVGVATNETQNFGSYIQLLDVASEVHQYSKTLRGSTYIFDRRQTASDVKQIEKPSTEPDLELPEEVQSSDEHKDAYISLIAHELRTPVTLMQTAIDVFLTYPMEHVPVAQKKYLALIQQSCRRLATTISRLASYDAIQHQNLDLTVRSFDPNVTLERIAELANIMATDKTISVRIDGPSKLGTTVSDEFKISQSIWEIVDNAIKFGRPQGTISIRASEVKGKIKIEVSDDGPGIPHTQLLRMFRSFHQMENPTTRRASGLGLGLYIAKNNIESIGGSIAVKSEVDKGSIFTISFPKRWRSAMQRAAFLQEKAQSVVEKAFADISTIKATGGGSNGHQLGVEKALNSLETKLREMEVLTNRAVLLAQEMSGESRREQDRVQKLKAHLLRTMKTLAASTGDQKETSPTERPTHPGEIHPSLRR